MRATLRPRFYTKQSRRAKSLRSRGLLLELLEARQLLAFNINVAWSRRDILTPFPPPHDVIPALVEGTPKTIRGSIAYEKDPDTAATLTYTITQTNGSLGLFNFGGGWVTLASPHPVTVNLTADDPYKGRVSFLFRPFGIDNNSDPDHVTISGTLSYSSGMIHEDEKVTIGDKYDANGNATCPKCACQTSACSGESYLGNAISELMLAPSSSIVAGVTQTAGMLSFAVKHGSSLFAKGIASLDVAGQALSQAQAGGPNISTELTVFEIGDPVLNATTDVYDQAVTSHTGAVSYYSPTSFSTGQTYRFASKLPGSTLAPGAYDWMFQIKQGTTVLTTLYGQTHIEDPNSYPEWGPGWGVEGMSKLRLSDVDYSGVIDSADAVAESQVWVALVGGSRAEFRRDSSGNYDNGEGEFANWKLTFDSTLNEYVISTPDGSKIAYDEKGRLKRQEDYLGNKVAYAYGANGLSRITYPSGRYLDFAYSGTTISSVIDNAGGNHVVFGRDGSGRINEATYDDPDGSAGPLLAPHEKFDYVSTSDSKISARHRYPEENETTVEDTTFGYDADGRLQTLDKPNQDAITYAPAVYAGLGSANSSSPALLMLVTNAFGSATQGSLVTQARYNTYGQPLEIVDAAGNHWHFGYTSVGRLSSTTIDPDGSGGESPYVMSYTYFSNGLVDTITHPDGTTETFVYDASNPPVPYTGQIIAYKDRLNRHTKFNYDASSGMLLKIRHIVGGEDTPYGSDTTGDDVITTFEQNTPSSVNVKGLPSAMIVRGPNGSGGEQDVRTNYTYTSTGQLLKEVVAVGTPVEATRQFVYNAKDQLERVYTELWNEDNFTGYATWTDAKDVGHYYDEFVYDGLGRLLTHTQIDPDGTASAPAPVWTYGYDRENRLKKIVDPINRLTQYVYQVNGNYSESEPDHDSNGFLTTTTYNFDGFGRLANVVDPMYFVTSYGYDNLHRPTSVTLPDPDIVYSASGSVLSNGTRVSPILGTTYDALGRVTTETDARGSVTNVYYSNSGKTIETRLPSPGGTLDRPTTQVERDAVGNITKIIEGSVPYNATADTAMTPIRWTRFEYDQLNRVTKVWRTQPGATGGPSSLNEYLDVEYEYDKSGNQTRVKRAISIEAPDSATNPLRQVTELVYDQRNRVKTVTEQDPDPNNGTTADVPVWAYQYDKRSRLTEVTDPAGNATTLNYDRLDRRTSVVLPDPDAGGPLFRPWFITTYDALGRVTRQTDPVENATVYFYDTLDDVRQVDTRDAANQLVDSTVMRYDANERLIAHVVNGGRTNYEYDNLGNVTKVTQPDPDDVMSLTSYTNANPLPRPFATYTYDANSNLDTETNELGKVTDYNYDNLNRLTTRTDPDPDGSGTTLTSPVTSYTYDVFSNLLTLTDPDNNTTTWAYDLLDRVKTETIVLGGANKTRSYKYNLLGNLTEKTDRLGRVTRYTNDRLGRRTREEWMTNDPTPVVSQFISFAYDTRGNLTQSESGFEGSSTGPYAVNAYTYNAASWVIEETLKQANLLKTKFAIGYDTPDHHSLGQRSILQASFSTNTGFTTFTNDYENEYTYDGKNRLKSITQSGQTTGNAVAAKHVTFAYNPLDQVTDIDRYADTTASAANLVAHSDYDRDFLGRIKKIDHLKGTTHFATYDITYDDRSRISAIDEVFSNPAWNYDHDFTYDDTDQLKTATHLDANDVSQKPEAYAYDQNGNRTGHQTFNGLTDKESVVGEHNRITSDGTYTYTYDAEGNMTTKKLSSDPFGPYEEYIYDYRNRLVRVAFHPADGVASDKDVYYRYDYANRLIRRIFDSNGAASGGQTNQLYIHDGDQIVMIFDRPGSTATLTNRLLWGPEQDMLISDEQVTSYASPGTVNWALLNHLNSVADVVNFDPGTGVTSVVEHRSYDGFGNVTFDSNSAVITIFGFTGKLLDATTGLQNNINRWYASWLGQFITEDPIGFLGGDENLRRYVGNHPTYARDPDGLWEESLDDIYCQDNRRFSERLSDDSQRHLDQGHPIRAIVAGMFVGPVALVDGTVYSSVRSSAAEGRSITWRNIESTNDPIQKGAGYMALAYNYTGEGFALFGLAEGSYPRVVNSSPAHFAPVTGGARLPRAKSRPLSAQPTGNTCGPTSVDMVLETVTPARSLTHTVPLDLDAAGTTIDKLAAMLRRNGQNAQWARGYTVEQMAAATQGGNPLIAHVRTAAGGHFVVVDGVTTKAAQQLVAIRDPAHGQSYFLPAAEFKRIMSGHVIVIK